MSVTIDGIISGFDTTSLIDAILTASAANKDQMEQQLEADQASLDKLSELSSLLEDLSDAIDGVQSDITDTYTATVAEGVGFTAETSKGVAPGTYQVDVLSLAASEMEASQGFADASAMGTIAQGTLTVTVAGVDNDVTIDGTNDSLSGLAEALDAVDGIRAYVLNTGSATDPYKLVVQSQDSGATNTLSFDTSGLAGGTVPAFTEIQAGADAHLTVNGLDVYSSSNDVKAIPGLTLSLQQAGLGPAPVEVALDQTAFEEQVQALVDSYNEVIDHYAKNTVFNQEVGLQGPLVGDSTARRTIDQLGSLVSNPYTVPESSLSILAQIGIETQQDGTLELDTEALSEALAASFDDVVGLLTSETGALATIQTQIDDVFVDPDSGTLSSRQDSLQDSIDDLKERIDEEEERLASQADTLRGQFTAMEATMAELQTTTLFLSSYFTAPAAP
ncbi:MAG TPA: hypothetical protein ENK18_09235 [Deltaproteobacteria bacterium]|nr:hypothetical protein [Deltaproteobacteria bacterium]